MNTYMDNHKIEDFPLTVGRNCLLSSIKDILSYYKIEISECELYFLCRAFRFSSRASNHTPDVLSDWFSYDQHQSIEKYVRKSFACEYRFSSSIKRNEIMNYLNANQPLSILMHPKFITYNHRIFQPVGIQEMHCFNLYGYDNISMMYDVADATVTNDNGMFICLRTKLDYSIVEKCAIGYFVFHSVPVYQYNRYELLHIIEQTLSEFIEDLNSESAIKGIEVLKKIFVNEKYKKSRYYNEIMFLMQAYFMPVFFYLEDFFTNIIKSPDIIRLVKIEKNKWDVFYYKYLLRLKKDCNNDMMEECYNRNICNLPHFLVDVCNNIREIEY